MATKKCLECDTAIGETETVCPKCGLDFEEYSDESLSKIERANKLIEKRRAAAQPPAEPPKPAEKKQSIWDALRKKKA